MFLHNKWVHGIQPYMHVQGWKKTSQSDVLHGSIHIHSKVYSYKHRTKLKVCASVATSISEMVLRKGGLFVRIFIELNVLPENI